MTVGTGFGDAADRCKRRRRKKRQSRPRLMVYSMLSFVGFSFLISIAAPILAAGGGLVMGLINIENEILSVTLAIIFIIMYLCTLLFFVWLFAYFMIRKVLTPIDRLTKGLRQITSGNSSARLTGKVDYEFEEMQTAFNYMADRLESAEKAKLAYENERSMIFSNISHDLKTPISTIAGYAGALSDGMVTDGEKQSEYLSVIKAKALHINELVELLFEYARLDNQQYELHREKIELTELLRGVIATMYNDFENQSITLDVDLPDACVEYFADRLELSRAVNNLLSNALLHNEPGRHVAVSLTAADVPAAGDAKLVGDAKPVGDTKPAGDTKPSGGAMPHLQILVSDDGDPIPEELASRLFTPFVVGDESRSSRGGSGLGLAITRKIIERHGGRVMLIVGPAGFTKSFAIYLPYPEPILKSVLID